jgi:general secretion pathway protein G
MKKPKSLSPPELLQFFGALVFIAGLMLTFYTVLGQVIAVLAPGFVKSAPGYTDEFGSFMFNHPGRALLLAFGLMAVGGLLVYVSSRWAFRNERLLRARLELLRAALKKYKTDTGHHPSSLKRLVEEGYLREIPRDPISWPRRSWAEERSSAGEGIINIRSKARSATLGDSSYDTW